jgi:aspartate kinase
MPLVVQKYGGSSLGTVERLTSVAERVVAARKQGKDLVVVVSAMGDTTDELVQLASKVSRSPSTRELDMLLTAGERISMALLAMAINDRGCEAISFTGSQSGIITDSMHTRARIVDVKAFRINEELSKGRVVIVAGFQGVSSAKEVTTLGRGGSDTTAVALASAFKASECEIFTDVDGIYTADPRVVKKARKLDSISFEEMLELSASGAGVVHHAAVELAYQFDIPLQVRSSFSSERGTTVTSNPVSGRKRITGIAHTKGIALVNVRGIGKSGGATQSLLRRLAEAAIEVRLFSQCALSSGEDCLLFAVPETEREAAKELCEAVASECGAAVDVSSGVGLVSIVGGGLLWTGVIASEVFTVLDSIGASPSAVSSSAITLSCLIPGEKVEQAVRELHRALVEDRQAFVSDGLSGD